MVAHADFRSQRFQAQTDGEAPAVTQRNFVAPLEIGGRRRGGNREGKQADFLLAQDLDKLDRLVLGKPDGEVVTAGSYTLPRDGGTVDDDHQLARLVLVDVERPAPQDRGRAGGRLTRGRRALHAGRARGGRRRDEGGVRQTVRGGRSRRAGGASEEQRESGEADMVVCAGEVRRGRKGGEVVVIVGGL